MHDTFNDTEGTMTTGATDIHTHIVPASFPAYAGRHANARWPSMAPPWWISVWPVALS